MDRFRLRLPGRIGRGMRCAVGKDSRRSGASPAGVVNPAIPHIPTPVSLAFIVLVLAVTGLASWLKVRKDPTAHAHAGRVGGGHHEEPSE